MSSHKDAFDTIIRRVLPLHGVSADGKGSVPVDKMAPIAKDVRDALDAQRAPDDDLHAYFDLLVAELSDQSMTAAGRYLALKEIAAGFRFKVTLPN